MEKQERIEIDIFDNAQYPWGNIIDNGHVTTIGIYEDGKVARSLFVIDRHQLKQLVNTLQMLIKD